MLLSIIRQNQKLAAKRNPAFDRNRFAKFFNLLYGRILGSIPHLYRGHAVLRF